ncbi:MAG: peptidylprolyl isomerase, partial [bacterium]
MLLQNSKKVILVFIGLLGLAFMLSALGCGKKPDLFTDDNVVAQFVNGVITTDQLTAYISKIGPKCHTPVMSCHGGVNSGCDSDKSCSMHDSQMQHEQKASAENTKMDCCGGQHGGEHAGCCGGSDEALKKQPCEEHENCCMQHYDLKAEDYRELVKAMVLEQMLQEYIKENKIGLEENTQDLIKYVTENVYVTDTHLEMEENMKPPESEIRKYYEENKRLFGLRRLNEVRDEIVKVLKKKMHHEYMPKYLAELKRNAFIRKNLELIRPREPSESELRNFYRDHRSEYEEPEKIKVRQILTHSRQKAEQAQSQLRSNVSFATVAEKYSEGPFAEEGGEVPSYIKRGDRGEVFEENVFNLREGDTSILFEDKGSFYIVQVLEKHAKRVKSFEEVADSIRESLMIEKEKKIFEDNAQRTLFTVN